MYGTNIPHHFMGFRLLRRFFLNFHRVSPSKISVETLHRGFPLLISIASSHRGFPRRVHSIEHFHQNRSSSMISVENLRPGFHLATDKTFVEDALVAGVIISFKDLPVVEWDLHSVVGGSVPRQPLTWIRQNFRSIVPWRAVN